MTALEVTTTTKVLSAALSRHKTFVAKKATLPILQTVELSVCNNGSYSLRSTDLEKYLITGNTDKSTCIMSICIDYKDIVNTVKALPAGEVTIKITGKMSATLQTGKFSKSLTCLEACEFPPTPHPSGQTLAAFALPASTLITALTACEHAVSTDFARPVLCGYSFTRSSTLWVEAADGFTLAKLPIDDATLTAWGKDSNGHIVITGNLLKDTKAQKETGNIGITAYGDYTVVSCSDWSIYYAPIVYGGTYHYPDLDQLIPAKNASNLILTFNTADLLGSLKLLESNALMRIKVSGSIVTFSQTDGAEVQPEVTVKNLALDQSKPFEIGFNSSFLANAAAAYSKIGSEAVSIKLRTPKDPARFDSETCDLVCVLMPMYLAK